MASNKGKYPQSFRKDQRLSGRKLIEFLFDSGKSINVFPFKVIFLTSKDAQPGPNQVLITIPKRNFKRSTQRNLLKRRIREAFRKNKYLLEAASIKNLLIAYIYIDTGISGYGSIEKAVIDSLNRIVEETKK